MLDYKRDTEPRHPIGVASTRTGIAQDVLRAWERRYGAVVPHRTPTGRRLYSDADLVRLGLLRRLVEAGRRISDIANATTDALRSLADEDRRVISEQTGHSARRTEIEPASYLDAALEAVAKLDKERLEKVLNEAAISMSAPELRRRLIVPLLREIGHRWRTGRVRIVHERLVTTIVRRFMDGMRDRADIKFRPRMVVTTPAGQRHELGAIMVAAAAEEIGWEAVYLGADLPAEEIAVAAREMNARVVALSLVYKGDNGKVLSEIGRIRQVLDPGVSLIVGGQAATSVRKYIEDLGATFADDLGEFQSRLELPFVDGPEA